MDNADRYVRPSRITIPPRAHPAVRLMYQLMRDQGVTYDELEHRSGVLRQTFKSWRTEKVPSLRAIEATLGALGWSFVPCPPIDNLPASALDQLEDAGLHLFSDDHALAAAVLLATRKPRAASGRRAPRVDLKAIDWAPAS